MDIHELRNIIRESFESQMSEGTDGNYMSKQNIESIINSAEIINANIEEGSEQEDWVEDKLSKIAENLLTLRVFFEKNENNETEIEEIHGVGHTLRHGSRLGKLPTQGVSYRDKK